VTADECSVPALALALQTSRQASPLPASDLNRRSLANKARSNFGVHLARLSARRK
jgi:hypothetical protein